MVFRNQEISKLTFNRELIIGEILAVGFSFVTDFLKPLGNFTFYIFLFSVAATAILISIYLTKKLLKKNVFQYLIIALTIMAFSGSLYVFEDESNSETGVLATNFPAIRDLQVNLGVIEKNISDIKESTLRTEKLVESLSEDSKENINQTKELNKTLKASSEAIVNKLDDINNSFSQIAKLGGLIIEPERPEEFYHNSRLYEERGDYLNARRSYNQYFVFGLDFIDPHLRYQTFLKIQEGRAGAREVYNSFFENEQRIVIEFLKIILFDAPTRTNLLKEFISRNPDFAPAYFELSKDYSPSRTGQDSLSNSRQELNALETFIQLNNKGKFVKYFLDKELASDWINYAQERLKILNSRLNEVQETYLEDGTVFKKTNFKNGIREGEELVFSGKSDSITIFNGLIVNHRSNGTFVNVTIKALSWYEGENILIRRNFYVDGNLKRTVNITYYNTGEIFKKETVVSASKETLENLRTKLDIARYLYETEEKLGLEYKINKCDENFGSPYDNNISCLGSGPSDTFYLENKLREINDLEEKINNAKEVSGPYQYFYKNGQLEEEGIYNNGVKVSYAIFSEDGILEERR